MLWFVGGSGGMCRRGAFEELVVENLLLGAGVSKLGEGGGFGLWVRAKVEVRLGRGQR